MSQSHQIKALRHHGTICKTITFCPAAAYKSENICPTISFDFGSVKDKKSLQTNINDLIVIACKFLIQV